MAGESADSSKMTKSQKDLNLQRGVEMVLEFAVDRSSMNS